MLIVSYFLDAALLLIIDDVCSLITIYPPLIIFHQTVPVFYISSYNHVISRHEIGHNFGHEHHYTHNYLHRFLEPQDSGYKNLDGFDMMSGCKTDCPTGHFHLASKWHFGWVSDSAIIMMQPQGSDSDCPKCQSSGTYTLYPFDLGGNNKQLMGIHIPITAHDEPCSGCTERMYSYWLTYRGGNDAKRGLSVHMAWFYGVGSGTFKAAYDQVSYDVYGDTETTDDSFVLSGDCYHIHPNKVILSKNPEEAVKIQPVVCVKSMKESKQITIDVVFHDPTVVEEPDTDLECGSSTTLTLPSNNKHLIRVKNTGKDGVVNVELRPSSGSAKTYYYDRYPHSSQNYKGSLAFGAYFSSEYYTWPDGMPLEYGAINNEAWISIESGGQTQAKISCEVNDCIPGQKNQRGKCVACDSNESCERCPDAYSYFISKCMLTKTFKEIESSTQWRIFIPAIHTFE